MQNDTIMDEVAAPTTREFVARKPFTLVLDIATTGTFTLKVVSPSGRKILIDTFTASAVVGRQYGCGTKYELDLSAVGTTATAQINQL